jgi:acyl-CoA thioesterase FadM
MVYRPFQVCWHDLDTLGHVSNAVYLTTSMLARLVHIQALLGADAAISRRTLLPVNFQFILAEVTCTIARRLRCATG